jgi:hypothetical protein
MSSHQTEICMRVPLSGGRFCFVIFDPTGPADFAPLHELNSARMAQPSAPLFLKPLKENGAGAPLLHSAPLPSHEWRKPSPSGEFLGDYGTQKSPLEEIAHAQDVLASKASAVAVLDDRLAPVRIEEQAIRSRIVATHAVSNGVTMLDLGRRGDRAPLFVKLDEIARKWGPLKSERKVLFGEIKTLERQIDHLRRLIDKQDRKRV